MRAALMVLACAFCLPVAAPAQAPAACAPREIIVSRLAERFGEEQIMSGLDASGHLVEVYGSVDRGTWTLIATRPGGLTCMLASGAGFAPGVPLPKGDAL